MTTDELKAILKFAENYFLNRYPGKDIYVQEILSHVGLKYANYYDIDKGEWRAFVIMLTEQKWSEIYKRDYKILVTLIDGEGNETIKKLKPTFLDDLRENLQINESGDEELLKAAEFETAVYRGARNQRTDNFPENENNDSKNEGDLIESEFELSSGARPPIEPPKNLEDKETPDNDNAEHLIAFYKLQMILDDSPQENKPISQKYFENVPSLSMAILNTRKMSGFELFNNLDYYKYITWLDKDNTRFFQELALQQMILQEMRMDELYGNYCEDAKTHGKSIRGREEFPYVGAVLVSEKGEIIASSYKGCNCIGYDGNIAEHCEYLLFEKVLGVQNIGQAKGGSLFVTLEPCVSRISGKVPCAVRCLESGIKNVYIGTFDPDRSVSWKGVDILKTGSYEFKKRETFYTDEHGKELQKYFREKGYREEETSLTHTFFISDPVNFFPFNADLTLEIIKRNEKFVKYHNWHLFVA